MIDCYRLLTDVAASREVAVGGAITETGVLTPPPGCGVTCGLLLRAGCGDLSWMFVSCLLSHTIIFSLFWAFCSDSFSFFWACSSFFCTVSAVTHTHTMQSMVCIYTIDEISVPYLTAVLDFYYVAARPSLAPERI